MKDAIDGPPSNAGISSGPSSHVRVCATLKNLSSELRELVTALQTFQTQQPSIEMETIVSELTWQLDNATQLVQGLKTYPEVYRTMSATYIRTQCQRVCRSIGEGIERKNAAHKTRFGRLFRRSDTNARFKFQRIISRRHCESIARYGIGFPSNRISIKTRRH